MTTPAKFAHREQNNVFYHGGDNVPFPIRTAGGTLMRQHEIDQLVPVGDYKAKLFDMAEEADVAAYSYAMELIVNRQAALRYRVDRFAPGDKAPKIWLEWVVMYMERPVNFEPDRIAAYGFRTTQNG